MQELSLKSKKKTLNIIQFFVHIMPKNGLSMWGAYCRFAEILRNNHDD
jgi:hypothetical protein